MKMVPYFLCLVFVIVPVSAARPMTSLFADELGASMMEIGLFVVCYSIVPLVFAISMGRFTDKFGARIPIMAGSAGLTVSLLIPFFIPYLYGLYLSQLILGGSQLFSVVALQQTVVMSSTVKDRDQVIMTFSLFASAGMLLGPLIGGYAAENLGYQYSFLLISVFSFFTFIYAFFIPAQRNDNKESKGDKVISTKDLIQSPGLLKTIFISMLVLVSLDIFYVYFPLLAVSTGLRSSEIGWVLAIQAMFAALVRIFMPTLVQKFGRIHILSTFMFIGALAYGTIALAEHFFVIAIIAAIVGIGLGIGQPLTITLTCILAPEGRTGEALGARLAGSRLAQIIIPFMFAAISSATGLGAIFVIQGFILMIGAGIARGIKVLEKQ